MCGVRKGLLSGFPYSKEGIWKLAAALSPVPGTQFSLLSVEKLWLSEGNLNSLKAKGAHERAARTVGSKGRQRSWRETGAAEVDRGWSRASEG